MKKLLTSLLLIFGMLSCSTQTSDKLSIAVAANMQFPVQELMEVFERETGIQAESSIASSGKLTNQIKNGAPYEVFLSADMAYPQHLYEQHLTAGPPQAYAYGKLVLWSNKDEEPNLTLLKENHITHIAIGNPKLAPYGKAAQEVLLHYELYEVLKDKFVFGESIAQVNQFMKSGATEAGFTALAVVKSPENSLHGKWIVIPDSLYSPIAQGAVLLKRRDRTNEDAQVFYEFLFSQKGKDILTKYGYSFDK